MLKRISLLVHQVSLGEMEAQIKQAEQASEKISNLQEQLEKTGEIRKVYLSVCIEGIF